MNEVSDTKYSDAGVDTEQQETALTKLAEHVRGTWKRNEGVGSVVLDLGYFANVIDAGGIGIAISTDGIGTKAIVAQLMDKYDTVGIDCVAMNVNDVICVGATPLSMVDYVALQSANTRLLDELSKGLCDGAKLAGISISGGEIAQIPSMIVGEREGMGFDIAGTAIGRVDLDKVLVGQDIVEGDVVIGIESNGIHSNGLSLAQHVLFKKQQFSVDTHQQDLGKTIGEELLRPTHIYVKESLDLLDQNIPVRAFIHITSDGLLNLTRVKSDVGYIIDYLPPTPAIFSLLQECGKIEEEEMFRVFNMGIGFCVIVPDEEADRALSILGTHGKKAYRIGHAFPDEKRRVRVECKQLIGEGKEFRKAQE
ncbi:MAG: phosphoribosylformylglycinamidine cyclo-ligase [candidate division Zixibacteria bacterium]|nr:phosphoribosylformylglycinamidine cyclo-ligase [candidate division Zixibacteria bacterium]